MVVWTRSLAREELRQKRSSSMIGDCRVQELLTTGNTKPRYPEIKIREDCGQGVEGRVGERKSQLTLGLHGYLGV
jgi:hypothetical protein